MPATVVVVVVVLLLLLLLLLILASTCHSSPCASSDAALLDPANQCVSSASDRVPTAEGDEDATGSDPLVALHEHRCVRQHRANPTRPRCRRLQIAGMFGSNTRSSSGLQWRGPAS